MIRLSRFDPEGQEWDIRAVNIADGHGDTAYLCMPIRKWSGLKVFVTAQGFQEFVLRTFAMKTAEEIIHDLGAY